MIRLKDLSLQNRAGLGISCFLAMAKKYNPLINYDWSTTTTSGLRYLKDVGSTPTYNASMYFGRGAYLNGVDQYISINTISLTGDYTISFTSNTDALNQRILFGTNVGISNFIRFEATSITYRVNNIEYSFPFLGSVNNIAYYVFKRVGTLTTLYINGVNIVSKTIPVSTIIFDKVGTSAGIQYFKGTFKDVYMFNRALAQQEITQAYEQPEAFYAMAQTDSTCVLNMPMCETDGYARNMKSYSEVQKEYSDFNDGTTQGFSAMYDSTVSVLNNQLKVTKVNNNPYIGKIYTSIVGNYYKLKVNCNNKSTTGNIQIICSSDTSLGTSNLYMTQINAIGVESTYEIIVKATTTTTFFKIRGNIFTSAGDHFLIDNWEVTDLGTSIYPISNYTTSVRGNAKNLQYGLQTCKFVRGSLGVIQSASKYLECDGVGYIKTQWVPNGTEVFTLETVITPALVSKLQAHGNYGTSINEVQIGVTASNLVFASSLNSETVYLPYTENMHVCIVSDGVQSYYYCNNVLIKTTYNNSGSTINPFAFGGVNSGTIFNPTYDTLRLFKIHAIAYTSSQVDAAYYSLAKKNTIAYDVIPDECLYDENDNVYVDESGNYIGLDGYVVDESGEYYIV